MGEVVTVVRLQGKRLKGGDMINAAETAARILCELGGEAVTMAQALPITDDALSWHKPDEMADKMIGEPMLMEKVGSTPWVKDRLSRHLAYGDGFSRDVTEFVLKAA